MKKGKNNLLIRKLFNKLLRILITKTKLFKSLKRKRKTKLLKKRKKKLKSNISLFITHGWLEETFTFPSR